VMASPALQAEPPAVWPRWLPFSLLPIFLAILSRPAVDALFDFNFVKYLYMFAIFFGVLLARVGMSMAAPDPGRAEDERRALMVLAMTLVYFWYLIVLTLSRSGSLQDIFKLISPFLFFGLMLLVTGRWLIVAAAAASVMIIVVNACLLPTGFGWTTWGDAHTFKGFYFFKTDLAYALCFAVLTVAFAQRYRFTALVAVLAIAAAAQVVLSNSRLNYLSFALVIAFIALKGGFRASTIIRTSILGTGVAGAFWILYDPAKVLTFDLSDTHAFTQGRDVVWDVLIEQGLFKYGPMEWMFGGGMFADAEIYAANTSGGLVHNAHNEFLHLLITQGIAGFLIYLTLWVSVLRAARPRSAPRWTRGTSEMAVIIFLLQSVTTTVALFAQKTWPLAIALLLVRTSALADRTISASVGDCGAHSIQNR